MASFKATIPSLESAIKISGDGGMRLTLDIPESDLPAALYLLELRGQVLKVTIESNGQENKSTQNTRTPKRTKAGQRKRQGGASL